MKIIRLIDVRSSKSNFLIYFQFDRNISSYYELLGRYLEECNKSVIKKKKNEFVDLFHKVDVVVIKNLVTFFKSIVAEEKLLIKKKLNNEKRF